LDPSFLFYLFSFVILLSFSAFFSGAETAFFSLTKTTINKLSRSTKLSARQVAVLLAQPKKLLISIIIGNTISNVAIATLAALLTTELIRIYAFPELVMLLINVVVITLVILFFSEIIPKITAIKQANQLVSRLVFPLTFFYYLFMPLTELLSLVTLGLSSLMGLSKEKLALSDQELRTLVDVGEEKGALEKDEKEMIHSILEMSDTVTREIMVPRTDMIGVDKSASLIQVLNLVKDKIHSRIPVYDDSIDNIVGILFLKDLLPFIRKRDQDQFDLGKLAHAPYYVPEQKKINELLREFQKERIHMAIVVDEYGGTSGLVTLEDVIEEIVGEIQDEYDSETPLFEKIDNNSFSVDASMQLDELNEELGVYLPTEEGVDTLAGFLLGQFGSVPKAKEKLDYNGFEFIIVKATKKRIERVKIVIKK